MAGTIDEVIAHLTEIIDRSRRDRSRLGYFAALYRQVTVCVKAGIANNRFQNGERMERLDVAFASRYLSAATTGEAISKAQLYILLAVALGVLCEISSKRNKPDEQA